MRATRGSWALLALLCAGCSLRNCSGAEPNADTGVRPGHEPAVDPDRCREELAHAAVATIPGSGAIDVLAPACGANGTLVVWAMRGHTLSRTERSRRAGAVFSPASVVTTGADRLGPVAPNAGRGPLAWRSPTVNIEELDRDEWWVGWVNPGDAGAELTVHRGSVVLPPGMTGLGIIAPIAQRPDGVEVLASIAAEGRSPGLVRQLVRAPNDRVETHEGPFQPLVEGELKAWEPTSQTALAFRVNAANHAELAAFSLAGARAIERGVLPVERMHVLVPSAGVAARGAALFAVSTFDVVPAQRGGCLLLDPSLCAAPGPVVLLQVTERGMRSITVAPSGLVDAVSMHSDGRAVVLFAAPERPVDRPDSGLHRATVDAVRTRAALVDLASGAVELRELVAEEGLPPVDHPALVHCDGEAWMTAELQVPSEGQRGESAILALPLACVLRSVRN